MNGTTCNDGDACTQTDTCQLGMCVGGNPVMCTADACHSAGTCNPADGTCSNPAISCAAHETCSLPGGCACTAPYADCNMDAADGCEADTLTDPNNCNACGTVCPANSEGGAGVCIAGNCM